VDLEAGQSKSVHIALTPRDLQIYSEAQASFVAVQGTFTAYLGSSSRNIVATTTFIN
jgi:hypothetical protein